MGRINLDQAEKMNEGGGGIYFKMNQDESKQVRFLWDSIDEIANKWMFGVHVVTTMTPDGARRTTTVDCPRTGDPEAVCKYCSGEVKNSDGKRSAQVPRVVIPLFNIEENKIQYWVRSYDWIKGTLRPVLDEVANLPSIANQTFKIKRTGTGLDTTYTPIAVMNASDNKTKNDFGEIGDPYELGIIRKYGEENTSNQNQGQAQPAPQGSYQPRRTTEMF